MTPDGDAALVATQVKVRVRPASAKTGDQTYVELVAPTIGAPPICHCRPGAGAPAVTDAVKVTESPRSTVVAPLIVNSGATGVTVNVMTADGLLPATFDAVQVKLAPLSAKAAVNDKLLPVAPPMIAPLRRHCRVGVGEPVAVTARVAS